MRLIKTSSLVLLSGAALATLAACGTETKQQLATVTHVDSARVDSLGNVRKDLLDEVMTSTQFVNQINSELAKARALANKPRIQLDQNSEGSTVNEERRQVIARVSYLVAKLDSVQARVATTRRQAQSMSKKDSALIAQIASYEKSMADMQASAEQQRADLQKVIDRQSTQIATLNGEVDTLNRVRNELHDQVGQLTAEKNTAYYVIGTREELLKKGILVSEGHKRFLVVGSRTIVPARSLDPSAFTKIDRLSDRTITLPEGSYEIFSRQNPAYATSTMRDGKISGALTIEQPEEFWAPSKFLIIVRS